PCAGGPAPTEPSRPTRRCEDGDSPIPSRPIDDTKTRRIRPTAQSTRLARVDRTGLGARLGMGVCPHGHPGASASGGLLDPIADDPSVSKDSDRFLTTAISRIIRRSDTTFRTGSLRRTRAAPTIASTPIIVASICGFQGLEPAALGSI